MRPILAVVAACALTWMSGCTKIAARDLIREGNTLYHDGKSAGAKSVFATMLAEGGAPSDIVRRLGLDQALSAQELLGVVDQVLAGLPAKVAEYRAGKTSLLGMFTGQVIKATGGKASPQAVQEILKDRLA